MQRSLLFLLLNFVLTAGLLAAQERIRVTRVTDSGRLKTSWLGGVRLAGVVLPRGFAHMHPPEYHQDNSLEALRALVESRTLRVEKVREGGHTRVYAYLDSLSVNAWLLRNGHVRWDGRTDHRLAGEFARQEREAREQRLGLWLNPFAAGTPIRTPGP